MSYPLKLYTPNVFSLKIVYPKRLIPQTWILQIFYFRPYPANVIPPKLYAPNVLFPKPIPPKSYLHSDVPSPKNV